MAEPIVYELSSDCRCTETDDDGNELKDDNGYPLAADYCHGCWEDDLGNTESEIIKPWLKANGITEDDYIAVSVERATWQNVSGNGVGKADLKSILKMLTFNGDWTLEFTYDGDKTLIAKRWSHDEPMGTSPFLFRKATEHDIENWEHR
jgi:hypothetical protein